jgi:hypothetical protein
MTPASQTGLGKGRPVPVNTNGAGTVGAVTAVVVVEAAAIGLLAVLVFALMRTQARIVGVLRSGSDVTRNADRSRSDVNAGNRVGKVAPPLAGVDLAGRPVEWDPQGPAGLAFLTSGCASCGWWWGQLRDTGRVALPGLVVVTPDPGTDSPDDVRPLAGDRLRVIMSSDGWGEYQVRAGSTFVVVEGGRIRASGAASDWEGLVALVGSDLSG